MGGPLRGRGWAQDWEGAWRHVFVHWTRFALFLVLIHGSILCWCYVLCWVRLRIHAIMSHRGAARTATNVHKKRDVIAKESTVVPPDPFCH